MDKGSDLLRYNSGLRHTTTQSHPSSLDMARSYSTYQNIFIHYMEISFINKQYEKFIELYSDCQQLYSICVDLWSTTYDNAEKQFIVIFPTKQIPILRQLNL